MSALENPEAATILDEIGNLYLNKNFSDVTFIVGGEKLPAHRTILGQRCPVFKSMFLKPHVPETLETISMNETPLDAFMVFLKFVYTGVVQFNAREINFVFETLQLAKAFEMMKLENICVDHLKTVCAMNNVTDIVNEAVNKSDNKLVEHCLDYISKNSAEFIKRESFPKLNVKVLERVFQERTLEASDKVIFNGFVEWMKANSAESAQFPELLKHIKLNAIALDDLVTAMRPYKLIDANDFMDIVYEQTKSVAPAKPDEVVKFPIGDALAGAEVLNGGYSTFFTMPTESATLRHKTGNNYENIVIDMRFLYMLNYLEMELANGDKSYWIEISEDNVNWTRMIDYSDYVCRSVQRLYFKEFPVRYIRIHGTAPANDTFEITRFEAYYVKKPLEVDPETGIVIPSDNVALSMKNAIVIQGINSHGYSNALINGSSSAGHTFHQNGESIIVQLPQPYVLNNMKLRVSDSSSCEIKVSTDKVNWTHVSDIEAIDLWTQAHFAERPVVFIKLVGYNHICDPPSNFGCMYLECCTTKRYNF